MASFEPSIISQIPDFAGNPTEARAKGYKLADLITEQQRNKLLLGEQQQQVQDEQKARDILKSFDPKKLGTAEGNIELAGLYGKAGLDKYRMQALQFGSQQQNQELEKQKLKIQMAEFFANDVGPAALEVQKDLKTNGLAHAQALYQQRLAEVLQRFPEGQQHQFPTQLPNDPAAADAFLTSAVSASQKATKIRDEARADERLGLQIQSGERSDRRLELAVSAANRKAGAEGGFSDPKVQELEASIASTGFSLPAGFRAKEQQLALYKGLLRKYDGLDPDDIAKLLASNAIDYKGISKATQTAAGIAGKVEFANNELTQFVPIARDASAAVDRTSFVPYNKLAQIGKANISDPDQKRLFVATQTILNAYDLLAARGGTDKDKRAENRKILETADGPEAYNAALDFIVKEGQAAGVAAQKSTKASAYGGIPGGKTPAETSSGGPSRINSDADYNALPSGATFIAPDGTTRRKP